MKLKMITLAALTITGLGMGHAFAEDGVMEKTGETVSEGAQDTAKHAKKAGRKVKHTACKMVNGKEECAGMAVKNTAKNAGDEVSDKANDVKKKVD